MPPPPDEDDKNPRPDESGDDSLDPLLVAAAEPPRVGRLMRSSGSHIDFCAVGAEGSLG